MLVPLSVIILEDHFPSNYTIPCFWRMKVLNQMIWKKISPWCLLPLTPAAWSWQSKKFGLVLQLPPTCAPQPMSIQGIVLPDVKERKWQLCFAKLHLYLAGSEWNFNNFWSFFGNYSFDFVYIRVASVFYCVKFLCNFCGSTARKFSGVIKSREYKWEREGIAVAKVGRTLGVWVSKKLPQVLFASSYFLGMKSVFITLHQCPTYLTVVHNSIRKSSLLLPVNIPFSSFVSTGSWTSWALQRLQLVLGLFPLTK